MKKFYFIIAMCLSLCFVISCGGDTNQGDVNDGDLVSDSDPLNGILAEVISIYDDYLATIVTGGDDNFSQDDQVNVYCNGDCVIEIETIQIGDILDVMYSDNDFSKTDDVYSINAYAIGIIQEQ